jgi:hypothetical protein
MLVFVGPYLAGYLSEYVRKRGDSTSFFETADLARGGLIFPMLDNIRERPFTGIGFGLASNLSLMRIDRDPIMGLPIGASIEKGVLPIAVFEELGLLGFILVAAWTLMTLRKGVQSGLTPFIVLLTALCVNCGESTLFSPGGMGLFSLVLIGWAVTPQIRNAA